LGFKKNHFSNSEKYGREALSIPIYPSLNFKDQIKVINEIKKMVLL
jgi:dTDP-4-amino-4,6-dideoxygalactose transaminase